MSVRVNLTAKRIEMLPVPAKGKARHLDYQEGLMLVVAASGSKTWFLRFRTLAGIQRELKLGTAGTLDPDAARKIAREHWEKVRAGRDPVIDRQAGKQQQAIANAKLTLESAALAFIDKETKSNKWSANSRAAKLWLSQMQTYVFPLIGKLHPRDVGRSHVLAVLEQPYAKAGGRSFWSAMPKMAEVIRGKLERVLNYAEGREWRSGANPAAWSSVENVLTDPKKMEGGKIENRASLPFADAPALMAELQKIEGSPSAALRMTMLAALRSVEVRDAQWTEFDFAARVWTVPACRMKIKTSDHRVPLTDQMIAILESLPREGAFVFAGSTAGKPINEKAMIRLLNSLRPAEVASVHGFRATFRTWAGECTSFPEELAEACLAHAKKGGKVEAAYARGDQLERRRELMATYANYVRPVAGDKVIPLRRVS